MKFTTTTFQLVNVLRKLDQRESIYIYTYIYMYKIIYLIFRNEHFKLTRRGFLSDLVRKKKTAIKAIRILHPFDVCILTLHN